MEDTNEDILCKLEKLLGHNENGRKGIEELRFIINHIPPDDFIQNINCFYLQEVLNYYTGLIFEVKMPHSFQIGSIGGGGRYDDLTGLFDLPNIPGVGISFGVDRIYDVMNELNIFPEEINKSTTGFIFQSWAKRNRQLLLEKCKLLRNNGISCELFYENVKNG